ncbi:hypothetical protein D210916BOD24_23390 [Alteromonas sp. D210916BOD_24]|uniref:hypothetical protein n=1 Tax=Alteromonas sp. D210916BOD_24 TaxID=3157618 RepID=UPI00399C6351
MRKQSDTKGINTKTVEQFGDTHYVEEFEIDTSNISNSRLSIIRNSIEERLFKLCINPYRSIRAKSLIFIWRCGLLKGRQSENNNEFTAKFMALDPVEKQSLLAQTSHSQLVCVFSLSADTTLSDLLSHCSERAANLILADILHGRLNNNIDTVECAKHQAALIKRIEQLSL